MKPCLMVLSFLFLTSPALANEFVCELKERQQYAADYEDVNDFSFEDSPYLILRSDEGNLTSVTVGEISYETEDGTFELKSSFIAGLEVIRILYVEDSGREEILRITFIDSRKKIAIVESFEREHRGSIGKFGNCTAE